MNDFMNFIVNQSYILIPVLYILGTFFKRHAQSPGLAYTLDFIGIRRHRRFFSFRV